MAVVDALGEALAPFPREAPLIVGFSGGLDSCVLLHALRFERTGALENRTVRAAHLDHAMRPGSDTDARWVAGVCRAWGVPLHLARATGSLSSESDARRARYAFLDEARASAGEAALVLTAHHADDQAETVLFRMVRGTGLAGLRGIGRTREPGVARPLLGVWREDLLAYARDVRLRWRDDPTNEHLGFARNVIRHRVMPELERTVAPGARRSLVRLAGVAAEEADAWAEALRIVSASIGARSVAPADGPRGVEVDRARLLELGPALRIRVIRALAHDVGARLEHDASHRVAIFIETSSSGRSAELGGGASVAIRLDRVVFTGGTRGARTEDHADRPLQIASPVAGRGRAVLAGRSREVSWTPGHQETGRAGDVDTFSLTGLHFPIEVRGRLPGDRIRLARGVRKVKKLMLEERIPDDTRDGVPVVVDGEGEVLWIPGVARSVLAEPVAGEPTLTIRIEK